MYVVYCNVVVCLSSFTRFFLLVRDRIPDDHIVAVGNAFTIRNVDLRDSANFIGSANMEEVAVRAGFWDTKVGVSSLGSPSKLLATNTNV